MNKLISMTAFILNGIWDKGSQAFCEKNFVKIINYANFLSQKLELWMFVPCKLVAGVWVVLEEPEFPKPENRKAHDGLAELYDFQLKEYQESKDRVLFEGFEIQKDTYHQTKRTFYKIGSFKICLVMEFYTGRKEIIYNFKESGNIIDDLLKYNLTLSQTAKQQIGL